MNLSSYRERRLFLIVIHLLLFSSLWFWFNSPASPWLHELDELIFRKLNGSLASHSLWQKFWGMLNHRRETQYNLVIAALFNIWAVLQTQESGLKFRRIKQFLYFWICFQIGFMFQDYFFNAFLAVTRSSPSMVLEPVILLSDILNNSQIKDFSEHSFPSGHAFSLIYWASFTYVCSPKRIGLLAITLASFLCLPRLFSGAHWASDTIFSGLLALTWLGWTLNVPLYYRHINKQSSEVILKQPH